jgi:CubicO group peptidase (beta-lactamase class C family)
MRFAMQKQFGGTIVAGFVLMFLLVSVYPLFAEQGKASRSNVAEAPVPRFPDSLALTQLLDSLVVPGLTRHHIPGMVIVIVREGRMVLAKGYGYADLERKVPFDPDSTVIRIASVSKLFTGTAVMQLVERGLLDPGRDINSYLTRFKVDPWQGKPVTLRNLLTHTAGFDDHYIGKSALTQESQVPLGDFLATRLPRRICPPGEIYTYSNFSNALAGFVVEEVVHEDFAAYVRRNILEPLGMARSDYRLRPDLEPLLARCYSHKGSRYLQSPFDFINDYPGGQMLSTGTDMAKFMIAHLQLGVFADRRILTEESARAMQTIQFTHHPKLEGGIGYSFGIDPVRGVTVLHHDGGYTGVASRFCLCPELGIGFFLACNIMDGALNDEVTLRLQDLLVPAHPVDTTKYPLTVIPRHDANIADFAGVYRFSRYAHSSIEKLGVLIGMGGPELTISQNEDGMILMPRFSGPPRRMVQIEPCLFQSIDDGYICAFRRDASGEVTHLFTNSTAAFEKVPWYETISFQRGLFVGCMSIFGVVAILRPIIGRMRKRRRSSGLAVNPVEWFARTTSSTFLAYFLGLAIVVGLIIPQEELMVGFPHGMHWTMYVVQSIALVGILFLAALFGLLFWRFVVRQDTKESAPAGGWLIGLVAAVGGVAFVWFLEYWNLVGYHF